MRSTTILHTATHRLFALTSGALIALLWAASTEREALAQQDFAIALHLGQSRGLTPYQRDVVYASPTSEPDPALTGQALVQPFLADETNGWGTHVSLKLYVNDLFVDIGTQSHPRDQYTLHHRSDERISRTRQRPEGSYDDAGVVYVELDEERDVPAVQRNRGSLLVGHIMGGWRYRLLDFDSLVVYLPLSAGLGLAHILEPANPYRLGVKLGAGGQLNYQFAENFALSGGVQFAWLVTSQYKNREDAYRRAQLRGASTFQAMTSNMIQATLDIGLVFIVR